MATVVPILYLTAIYGAYGAALNRLDGGSLLPPRGRDGRRVPRATRVLLVAVAVPSALQIAFPTVLTMLRRDTTRILHGEVWRIATSLLVQDGGVFGTLSNLVALVLVGSVAERLLSRGRMLALFLLGGLAGELVGLAWAPVGAGNSVANFALAAGVAVRCLRSGPAIPVRFGAISALGAGLLLLLVRDLHGAAAMTGAVLSLAMAGRVARTPSGPPAEDEGEHRTEGSRGDPGTKRGWGGRGAPRAP